PLPDCMRRCALSCDWPRRLAGGHFLGGSGPANVLQLLEATCAKTHQVPAGVNRNERDPLLPTNFILPPVTGDPYPAPRLAHPVAFNPHGPWIWTRDPGAGNPFVACSGPTPVTACPNVCRSRRDG